jgi:hypothetical protein
MGVPSCLMGIRAQCPESRRISFVCRDNAAVLDLADTCLLPNRGADEAFLRHEVVPAGPGSGVIVFTARECASVAEADPFRGVGAMGEPGQAARRGRMV